MIDNNLLIWKNLQINNYFKNHRNYKFFQLATEDVDIIKQIKDKVIIDVGCGYGRETYYFSKYAKKVYGIEVSKKIIDEAYAFIKIHGDINKVELILADNYEKEITEPIDFIYSKHVFQHISPIICKRYLDFFKTILTAEGCIDILFRIGKKKSNVKNQEPLIEYTPKEIKELFKQYKIINVITQVDKKYKLWRIRAIKK